MEKPIQILTCFHTCADLEVLSEQDWRSGSAAGHIDTSWIKKTFNSYDESALELACRFADACGPKALSCRRTCVTAGGTENDRHLATLAAVGYDRTIRIAVEEAAPESRLSSEHLADVIAGLVRQEGPYDLILTGWQSGDGNQGKVPLLLAERLGLPCFTQVTALEPVDARHARITWQTDSALCTAVITLPAILVIGTVAGAFLRVPTLRQRMAAKQTPVEMIPAASLCADAASFDAEEAVVFCGMEPVSEARNPVVIDGSDPAEAAAAMRRFLNT